MKKWLRTQQPATTLAELQTQLDTFVDTYNHHRPHRSLPHQSTPAAAYHARPTATPGNDHPDSEPRVRRDRVHSGNISLRVDGHMHHIGVGRTLDGTPVLLLINGYDIRVIHAATGEIIRTLTINPEHRYHGTGGPTGPRKITRSGPYTRVRTVLDVSRHHIVELGGIEPPSISRWTNLLRPFPALSLTL